VLVDEEVLWNFMRKISLEKTINYNKATAIKADYSHFIIFP
jgi:hypothetical protein